MPPKRTRLKCHPIFTLVAVVFFAPAGAAAQTGRVVLQGRVSETVTLSVLPDFFQSNAGVEVMSTGNTVRLTLTSVDSQAPVIRVPLLVRSNSGFRISAAFESPAAAVDQLSITDVRATGRLVSPAAVSGLHIPQRFDLDARELELVSGPRVSLAGTLNSPNNALQLTVLIRLRSQPVSGQPIHLRFAAAPLTQ